MKHALFKVRTENSEHLNDDEFVETVMNKLLNDFPQIESYQYERIDGEWLHILLWGDIEIVP